MTRTKVSQHLCFDHSCNHLCSDLTLLANVNTWGFVASFVWDAESALSTVTPLDVASWDPTKPE